MAVIFFESIGNDEMQDLIRAYERNMLALMMENLEWIGGEEKPKNEVVCLARRHP